MYIELCVIQTQFLIFCKQIDTVISNLSINSLLNLYIPIESDQNNDQFQLA